MKTAFEIVQGFLANGFEQREGQCEKHGPSKALVRTGMEWHCGKCREEQSAKEMRQKWLEQRAEDLVKIANLPAKFAGQKWPAMTPAQKAVRGAVRQFRDFIVAERGQWAALVLAGKTGTGKTWLATELAEAMIRTLGLSVRYVTAQGIISQIQAAYGKEGKDEESEIDRFVRYDLLIIDEADVKRDNANASLLFTEVVNRRYINGRPIVMITNQAMENLEQYVGDRVFSRLHENSFVCSFDWPDFRKLNSGA